MFDKNGAERIMDLMAVFKDILEQSWPDAKQRSLIPILQNDLQLIGARTKLISQVVRLQEQA